MMASDDQHGDIEILRRLREADALWEAVRDATGSEFARQSRLRASHPEDLVRAALTLEELRQKARGKFDRATAMWFDRTGLEQATAEPVARHKARRFEGPTWDLCSGIGGDTLALAERAPVRSVDLSPAQSLRCVWNAEVYGVSNQVETLTRDVESLDPGNDWVHIDPDRRPDGRARGVRLEEIQPGVDFLERLMRTARGGAVKLSPASNFPGRFPEAEIELISLHGECKEATIWFGELAQPGMFRATSLPSGASLCGRPLDSCATLSPLRRYILDPDPAVVRAGLVDLLAVTSGCDRLDPAEEYLTCDVHQPTSFAQAFEVLAELPNSSRELRAYFRSSTVGQLEIKCRHIPIDAQGVRRLLPLPGKEPGVLIFARIEGRARGVVCRRLPAASVSG